MRRPHFKNTNYRSGATNLHPIHYTFPLPTAILPVRPCRRFPDRLDSYFGRNADLQPAGYDDPFPVQALDAISQLFVAVTPFQEDRLVFKPFAVLDVRDGRRPARLAGA